MKNKYQKQIIKAAYLLNLISPIEIQPYVDKYKADFSANKLFSIIFLKLFLFSWIFDRNDISLRTISQYSQSPTFKQLTQLDDDFSIGKTALGKRLSRISYHLFPDFRTPAQQNKKTSKVKGF